jgi:DNA-binding transcriptional LysR family regulator
VKIMSDLNDYSLFIKIVELGSISAAARARDQSVQSASRALERLERSVGTALIQRTTRALTPTRAGRIFFERIRGPLGELLAAQGEALTSAGIVAGPIRIGAPVYFGATCVAPAMAAFVQRHPALDLEFVLSDRKAQLLDERLDLAIRIGELDDSALRARHLLDLRRVIFAAKSWLARYGRPTHASQLESLPCVIRTIGPERDRWPVWLDGAVRYVRVAGAFRANDAQACNAAVAAGVGCGMAPFWQIRHLVRAGVVETLLDDIAPPPVPVHVLWHGTGRLPLRMRLAVEALAKHFQQDANLNGTEGKPGHGTMF